MDTTNKRRFARVDLEVSEIAYGSAPIGNLFRPIDEPTAQALVAQAWDAGIRYFDTAPSYGHGLSEHRVGHALLHHDRDDYVLSTKVGRTLFPAAKGTFDPGAWVDVPPMRAEFDYSYDGAVRQLHESLHRMMTDRVEIVLLHDADRYTHGAQQPERSRQALAGTIPAMIKMREEGVVKAVGAGLNDADCLLDVVTQADLDCLLVAGRYTLLEQQPSKELMDLCSERGVSVVLGGVFNSGVLATGPKAGAKFNYSEASPEVLAKAARISDVCGEYGVSLPAAAIQFVGAHPAVASVCLGARTMDQQVSNYAHASETIPADFWAALRQQNLIEDWAPTP